MSPAFAKVSRDDLTLWLAGPKSSAARPMPDGRRPEPGGWNRLVLEVNDLPSRVAKMKRSEEHTSELQSLRHLVCRLLLEKKKKKKKKKKRKKKKKKKINKIKK